MINSQPSFAASIARLFTLGRDQASPETINESIRSGVYAGGTNMWILMFAIMTASVGLNVNSTAVIIGAMLISPIMGPIIGAGYGAGINDFVLIRRSLRNLAIFVAISLTTSTLYFLLTPLEDAQSELLARTSPTIWDVLIAFFGGAAGMVGLTRKEKSTVIPGVAIATALMPPLCTTGYGIATGQPAFFLGAFYLFAINSVFIAFATLLITRILRLPQHRFADETARRRGRSVIALVVFVTLAPSIYFAWRLVEQQLFSSEAQRYIDALVRSEKDLIIAGREVDPAQRRIGLSLIGVDVDPDLQKQLEARLTQFKLDGATLDLHLASAGGRAKTPSAVPQIEREVYLATAQKLERERERARVLEEQLQRLKTAEAESRRLAEEIRAQFPATDVTIIHSDAPAPGKEGRGSLVVVIEGRRTLTRADLSRLERWLAVRVPGGEARVLSVRTRKTGPKAAQSA